MTGRGRWRHDVGRRGVALLILAALDTGYGTALLAGQDLTGTAATQVMTVSGWGTVWLVTALICVMGALSPVDRISYATAMLLKALWAGLILTYSAQHRTPGGWGTACVWLGLAAFVLLASAWPEVPRP